MSTHLLEHFSTLKDPRIERKKLHQLPDILFLAFSARLCRRLGSYRGVWSKTSRNGYGVLFPWQTAYLHMTVLLMLFHDFHRESFNLVLSAGLKQ